jgi:hypothetical protein
MWSGETHWEDLEQSNNCLTNPSITQQRGNELVGRERASLQVMLALVAVLQRFSE